MNDDSDSDNHAKRISHISISKTNKQNKNKNKRNPQKNPTTLTKLKFKSWRNFEENMI